MMCQVSEVLLTHLQALETRGFTVDIDAAGALSILGPDGQHFDGQPIESPIPRQWAAVLDAARSAGLTLDDLEQD